MKMKLAIAAVVVLLIACIALFINMNNVKEQAAKQHNEDTDKILFHSNQWSDASTKLADESQKNLALEKDVSLRNDQINKLSNDLNQTSETLSKTEADLKQSKEEMAKRDARITELETEKDALDKQAGDLRGSITNLEAQINDTQRKLDASEGDKVFLTKELNRLMSEKAELEKKFNDLAVLREQVKKLKEELSVSRRLDWIRRGIFASSDEKGATRLMRPEPLSNAQTNTNKAPDLNVEVNTDGSVKVIAPITNTAPPIKPQ